MSRVPAVVACIVAVATPTYGSGQAVQAARGTVGDSIMSREDYAAATGQEISAVGAPPPLNQYEDVAFAVGFDLNARGPDGIAVSTNLLGAAVGSAFALIGSEQLKSFLTDNLTAGFTIPSGSTGTIGGAVAVAIGGIRFNDDFAMFPTLGFEQTGADVAYVPSAILDGDPDQDAWTRPVLSVALLSPKMFKEVRNGLFRPVVTVGVRLPHFYTGNAFEALGALFTADRNKYQRGEKVRFTLGVALPLLRPNKVLQ